MTSDDRWKLAGAIWGLALLTVFLLWLLLNLDRDPSVEAGVAFGAGLVALFLVGVNAWFLHTLLRDLHLGVESTRRAASPLLTLSPYPTIESNRFLGVRVQNLGAGAARDVQILGLMLDTQTSIMAKIGPEVVDSLGPFPSVVDVPIATPPNSAFKLRVRRDRNWKTLDSLANVRGDPEERLNRTYYRVSCIDELGRTHTRWFLGRRELSGGPVPLGAAKPPDGRKDQVELLEMALERPYEGEPWI